MENFGFWKCFGKNSQISRLSILGLLVYLFRVQVTGVHVLGYDIWYRYEKIDPYDHIATLIHMHHRKL